MLTALGRRDGRGLACVGLTSLSCHLLYMWVDFRLLMTRQFG